MTSLLLPPVSTLLDRLFGEAAETDRNLQLSPQQRADVGGDYRKLYALARGHYLAISPATGKLLYVLARSARARTIVEFGTSFGVSTVHLAAALKDNGGGRLIGSEFEPSKAARARDNLTAAGLSELVEIREGDALESLSRDLPESIDMVLLDGAKPLYPRVIALLEPRLALGALVVADNADDSPEFLARVRTSGKYLSLPFAADVELSMWLGAEERAGAHGQ